MLIRFNDFILDEELSYIQSIIASPRWKWGWKSNSTDITSFWQIDDLKDDEFFSIHLLNRIKELTGDETGASIGDQKEDELKKKGISLTTFKKRNFV